MANKNASSTSLRTTIAEGTKITGKITSENDVYIDGEIQGSIRSASRIEIRVSGKVKGDLYSPGIYVQGNLNGNIDGDYVELSKSSKTAGQVRYRELVIESGAKFEGDCSLNQDIKSNPIAKK